MIEKSGFNKYIRPFSFLGKKLWVYFTGLVLYCIAQSAMVLGISRVYKLMGEAETRKDVNYIYEAGYTLFFVIGAVCIITPLLRYIFASKVRKAFAELRIRILEHITRMPVRYFEENHSGDIVSRYTNDIYAVETGLLNHFQQIVFTIVLTASTFVYMLLVSWQLTLSLSFLLVVSILVNKFFASRLKTASKQYQSGLGLLTERFTDFLSGFYIIKMFNIYNLISNKFDRENEGIRNTALRKIKYSAFQESSNTLIGMINLVGAIGVGAIFVYQKRMDAGVLLQFTILQITLSGVIGDIGESIGKFQTSLAGADRIFEILDVPQEVQVMEGKNTEQDEHGVMVSFKDVSFGYDGSKKALDKLCFSVRTGEKAALVGPSGGGKSTVIKLIMGFYPIESGSIILNGKAMENYKLDELRSMISYVPQEVYLFDGTIEENIGFGKSDATMEEIIEAAKAANAHDFILEQPEGYETKIGERGSKLSGGQKQRIAIARAFLKKAPLLLLDEATSALDTESEQLVEEALDRLMEGRTVIIVAHRLSTVKNSDRIFVIDKGAVVEYGNHDKLIGSEGLYNKLHKMQFRSA
ncbi:MAG: ABC transporter ATP-binding protein [Clostridiaceae bacterium]|nr:ABC transporter ATP-binding protein [Clostridiaceae bacterium]